MPVSVCLLVGKHPVCRVHAVRSSRSMGWMQDTVTGERVAGDAL